MVNQLKIVFRGIKNDKTLSILKLAGLVLAFSVTIPLVCGISYHKSFDRFHPDSDKTYNVYIDEVYRGTKDIYGECPLAIGEYIKDLFPEVESMVRTKDVSDVLISKDNLDTYKADVLWADPSFIEVFHLDLLTGNKSSFLSQPNEAYIAESLVRKIFGDLNSVGEMIKIDGRDYSISGIFKDYPSNSHQKFSVLLPLKNIIPRDIKYNWNSYEYITYVKLENVIKTKAFEDKIQVLISDYLVPWLKKNHNIDFVFNDENSMKLKLLLVSDIHLKGSFIASFDKGSDTSEIFISLAIVLVLLFIAYFNMMGFAFSKGKKHQFQLNIKRYLGESKAILTGTFIIETISYTLFAFICALVVTSIGVRLNNPFYEELTTIPVTNYILPIGELFLFAMVIAILCGLILGVYFSRILHKAGNKTVQFSRFRLNRIMLVTQMAASIILLVCIIGIYKQLKYISDYQSGINIKNIVVINQGYKIKQHYNAFKSELKKSPIIEEVSCSNSYPFNYMSNESYTHANSPDQTPYPFQYFRTDIGFQRVFNYEMKEGRWFSDELSSDKNTIILNEAAVRVMGLENPVGEIFYKTLSQKEKFEVIGVVDNFNFRSLHHSVEPLILYPLSENDWWRYIEIKGNIDDREKLLAEINRVWDEVSGNEYLNYSFLEDKMAILYDKEIKTKRSIGIFSLIAILISCFGLLGTVLNTTNEKTKEMGIRKINGAKVSEILSMLNEDFIKWVAIAFIIASPVAYYAMNKWLENFAYKTELSWWIFALAGVLALGIALLTVSWQSWKAATRNPVEALRYE
jgi:putative ABC transport system permease protein